MLILGVNCHSTWKGSVKTLQGLPLTMLILGGWSTLNLERIHEHIARITPDNDDPWGGGWLTLNLERIHEHIARITSDNVDPGGLGRRGVNQHSTWKGSANTLQGLPLTMLILGVNQHSTWKGSTNTLQGLLLTMLIWGGGVNWCSTWKGSANTLQGLPLTMLIWGVNWHSTWKGSTNTLQGLHLTMLILGGGRLTLNFERIHEPIARITSDNVDWGVNWHSTWKRSVNTLQEIPLTMLILGGQWILNLERIHKHITRITSDNVDPGGLINTQCGKDPWTHCKDYLWQCWYWGGGEEGVNWHSTWKGSANTLQGLTLTMLILGGQSTLNMERICEHIARITSDNVDPGGWGRRGVNWHSTWKGSANTLQGIPLTMLILGIQSTLNLERICKHIARITSDNVDPGGVNQHSTWKGSTNTLQGLPLTMLILGGSIDTQPGKDLWTHCKDYLWQCWSWGGLTLNLERIRKDIASITPHSVNPGPPTHTGLSVLYWLSYSTLNNSILHFLPR